MIRTSSASAHRQLQDSGRADYCRELIAAELARHPKGTSRRALEYYTGLRANQVSGRVNEMLKSGRAVESAHKHACPITGSMVFFVRLPGEGEG